MNSNVSTLLRYPGGKSIFTEYFSRFVKANHLKNSIYAEPYCGGAGTAINLLKSGIVKKIILNDADIAIYSFWYSIKYYPNEFLQMLEKTPVNLDEWNKQKKILTNGKLGIYNSLLDLGFSTFFLNRCNRSGILTAGPIGGSSLDKQLQANYKIDARFNKVNLKNKLLVLIELSNNIDIFNYDALVFLENVIKKQNEIDQLNTFVYLDPPYYGQGSNLYLNYYNKSDHQTLREFLYKKDNLFKWLLSYDNIKPIRELYQSFEKYTFYINYSAQNNKLGSELLIKSENSFLPKSLIVKKLKNKKQIELTRISE